MYFQSEHVMCIPVAGSAEAVDNSFEGPENEFVEIPPIISFLSALIVS